MKPDVNLESMQSGPTLPPELACWAEHGMGCSQLSMLSHLEPGWAPEGAERGWGCPASSSSSHPPPPFSLPPPSLLPGTVPLPQFLCEPHPWMCWGSWVAQAGSQVLGAAAAGA